MQEQLVTSRWRWIAAAASLALLATLASPSTSWATAPTSLAIVISPASPNLLDTLTFTATGDPVPAYGTVYFYDAAGDGITAFASATYGPNGAVVTKGAGFFGVGSHGVYGEFFGEGGNKITSPVANFSISGAPSTVTMTKPDPVQPESHEDFWITAQPHSQVSQDGGTMTFYRTGVATPVCTVDLGVWNNYASCLVSALPAGTYHFTAQYSGVQNIAPSSGALDVTVVPDVVHFTNLALTYSTFYPVTDGYRDTNTIKGERLEPVTTSIRIYSSSGTLVKSYSLALGSGLFSVSWNGRNSAGSVLAEGTYKIVIKLVDTFGTTATTNLSTTLSRKHLIYHTQTLYETVTQAKTQGGTGGSATTYYTSSPYIKMSGGSGYAEAGWQFTVASAVAYKSFTFKVEAKHVRTTGDGTGIEAQDATKPYAPYYCGSTLTQLWPIQCFSAKHAVGNSTGSLAWFSTGALGTAYHFGRTVRLLVYAVGSHSTYVYKVSVTTVYGLLGY